MAWSEPVHNARFHITTTEQCTTIRVAGDLDCLSVQALLHRLPIPQECAAQVVLDLSRVTFCGLAGVDLLLDLYCRTKAAAGGFELRAANSTVLRTVRLSRDPMARHIIQTCVTGHELTGHPHRAVLMQRLALALRLTQAPMGNAQACDHRTETLRIVDQRGLPRSFLTFFEVVADRESACGAAAKDRRAVYVEEVPVSPVFAGTASLDVLQAAHIGAVASVPVTGPDGRLAGVVSLHRHRPSRWSDEQRSTLGSLARSAGRLCQSLR